MTTYRFEPDELQEIANLDPDLPLAQRWELMHQELLRRHPKSIAPRLHWVFNSAGNLVCQLALVYASPVEYVAFFGTPVGAGGFSGRYPWADVWDLMVAGRMLTFVPGQFEPDVFGPGDSAYLKRGSGKSVVYDGAAWMIDYARGQPITMLPFGVLAPAFFTTLDFRAMFAQLGDYGRLVLRNWGI